MLIVYANLAKDYFYLIFALSSYDMKIKFLGHACFLVHFGQKTLLFDPFISPNELAKDINLDEINPDYILISHSHGDHVADVEMIAKKSGAKLISNFEIITWFEKKGLEGHPMNHGGKWKFDFGTVKYVAATHSSTMPDGSTGGNAGGFVIYNEEECFYYAGDTALTMDMKIIPITCPKLNLAILPIGDNFTMGYEDASIAAEWIACDKIIAMHFDTFGYIKVDHEEVKRVFEEKSLNITLPKIGQEIEI